MEQRITVAWPSGITAAGMGDPKVHVVATDDRTRCGRTISRGWTVIEGVPSRLPVEGRCASCWRDVC